MLLTAVLYVHGGGFVAGTPDMMRASNLQLARNDGVLAAPLQLVANGCN